MREEEKISYPFACIALLIIFSIAGFVAYLSRWG
jgi:hypothetical protein